MRSIEECRAQRTRLKKVAVVPTMGALHAGHLSLIKLARDQADAVVVSIFVNPTQFGPRDDFRRYPRPIEEDLAACEKAGVDLIFNPEPEEMYRANLPEVVIDLPQLSSVLEGKHRPGHFRGVCQVVAKLFHIIEPQVAIFGEKDFQQLRILTAMAEALDWPVRIVAGPTLREPDGLAMSSRNQYLSAEERARALVISRALQLACMQYEDGVRQTNRLITTIQKMLLEQHLNIDYVSAVDPVNLKHVDAVTGKTVLAIAARVGSTRLIDNASIGAELSDTLRLASL